MFRRDFSCFGECKSLQIYFINFMMKRTRSIEGETTISYITNFSNLRSMKNSLLLNIGQQ